MGRESILLTTSTVRDSFLACQDDCIANRRGYRGVWRWDVHR